MTDIPAADRRRDLPRGTVSFLFTDIQGSTKLLQRLGDDYGQVLATHRALLRDSFTHHRGVEVDTQGDAFFVAFSSAGDAVAAAISAQRALLEHAWPHGEPVLVRMGIHTGDPVVVDGHYVGLDVHRAARLCAAAHGGQVIVSERTHRSLARDAPGQVGFRDLGVHRLKDLEHPEHVLQLVADGLPADFPTLRSQRPPTNVPHGVGSLVGRRKEMNELKALLLGEDIRVVTVTGPGGTGKTRLAAAVARELLDDFVDGVFFVDLSTAQDAERVASEVTETLGVQPESGSEMVDDIADHIGDKHILLLLDNFEQALDGAVVISELLRRCPRLTAFVTSRIVLSIQSEREYPLAPLAPPDGTSLAAVEASEAAQLFIARATEARPDFAVDAGNAAAIAEICTLLDGLPLALELAAARVKLFSPPALVARLGDRFKLLTGGPTDRPDRHKALRRTIDWSYDLLTQQERVFFRRFAVFAGGATFDAIEQVIDTDLDALDALTALVDHSLVRRREQAGRDDRFRMLQTIREYALEKLGDDADRAGVRDRHAVYYLELARHATAREPQPAWALERIAVEHDNMRAALSWWLNRASDGEVESGTHALELAAALAPYWYRSGLAREGGDWLDRALSAAPGAPEDLRAGAFRLLGIMMEQQRELARAKELFEQALTHFRRTGDRAKEAACLNSLGIADRALGDLDAAERLFEASAELRRALGDEAGTSSSLSNLGIVAIDRGELDRAQELFETVLSLDRARDDDWGIACTLSNLGAVHVERGETAAARDALEDALGRFEAMGDSDGIAETLESLAGLAAREDRPIRSVRIAGAADALRNAAGIPLATLDRARLERWLERPRETLDDDAFERAWCEGAAMTTAQAIEYSLSRSTLPMPS